MPNNLNIPLDYTGSKSQNVIRDELVTLQSNQKYRSFTPQYAPYFHDSIEVREPSTQRLLVKDVEYKCLDLASVPTAKAGKDIYRTVIVLNSQVGSTVQVSYQTVGGEYVRDYTGIQELTDNLIADTRPLGWPSIVAKPTVYDPVMHMHSLGDVVGFEYVVNSLEMVKNSILMGDQLHADSILAYIDQRIADLTTMVNMGSSDLNYQAMLTAQSAKNNSDAILQEIQTQRSTIQKLNDAITALRSKVVDYEESAAVAENAVNTYLSSYPVAYSNAGSPILSFIPDTTPTQPIAYANVVEDILVDSDYYVLDTFGQAHIRDDTATADSYEDAALKIKFQIRKEAISGHLRLDLSVSVPDKRDETLSGRYAKRMAVKIFPFVFDRGDGSLDPVSAWYSNFSMVSTRVDNSTFTANYQIYGESSPVEITDMNWVAVAADVKKYLLDTRCDYNVRGYGQSDSRRAMTFDIPLGIEMVFSLKLTAATLSQVQKSICVNFSHMGDIFLGQVTNSILTESLIDSNPRGSRITAVSGKVT